MKLRYLLPIALLSALLAGCGAGGSDDDDSEQGQVRLINATIDHDSLDTYVSDSRVITGVAAFYASDYISRDSGDTTFKLTANGSTTSLLQTTVSVSSDTKYALVAYSTASEMKSLLITENESEPSSGYTKVRVINTSAEAGAVDLYLTGDSDDIASATAVASNVSGTGSYVEVGKGTYRIRVTGYGDKTDLRLDIPSVTFGDKKILNLVLARSKGGVLVNAILVPQQGIVTAMKNTYARMRVLADITSSGTVTASAGGVSLGSGLSSPAIGSYALVPAGTIAVGATVNGSSVSVADQTAEAGADLSLLLMGSASSPTVKLINDDNTPANTNYARIRLLNGVNGLDAASLTVDYAAVASNIASGAASTPVAVSSGSGLRLEATSSSGTALYTDADASLTSTKVYTMFLLGDNASPVGILRRDR